MLDYFPFSSNCLLTETTQFDSLYFLAMKYYQCTLSYILMSIAFNVPHTLKHMREVRSNMCHLMLFWSIFPSFLPIKSDKNGPFFAV